MQKNRDSKIDILRFLALLAIFIAHAKPPFWLDQLRSFEVPLMTILMGQSFYISQNRKDIDYWDYVKKGLTDL